MVVGAVAAVVAATGALDAVAAAAALTILVYYGITNVAALRLGAAERWLPAWVPAFGALACATLALSLDLRTIVIGLAVLMAGVLARVLQHR